MKRRLVVDEEPELLDIEPGAFSYRHIRIARAHPTTAREWLQTSRDTARSS
jgi:hypothetical protein